MALIKWFEDQEAGVVIVSMGPGDLLLEGIRQAAKATGIHTGAVISGLGSLTRANLSLLGQKVEMEQKLEIMQFNGVIAAGEPHIHITLADASGRFHGGHVNDGCMINTVAELTIQRLPGLRLALKLRDGSAIKLLDEE